MDSKTLMIVLFCLLMAVLTCGRDLINYSTALEKCKKRYGLASYKHFINSERRIEYNGKVLGHGKSLWISGNVSFSDKFVRRYGCFKPPKEGLRIYNISRNNIYECLKQCSTANTKYIGIGNLCYCIPQQNLGELKYSSDCTQQSPIINYVPGDVFSTENRKTGIDVYLLIGRNSLFWKPISNKNLGQCVYYQTKGTEGSYVTGSCYTKGKNGFICTNNDYVTTHESCSNYNQLIKSSNRSYCYFSQPSTWISSYKHCKQHSLNLIGTLEGHVKPKIDDLIAHASFWTGLFRTFNLSEFQNREFAEESNICLSVMNMNNTLVFDPVDCSLEKGYICEDDIPSIWEQTTYTNSLSSTTVEVVHSTRVPSLVLIIALTILAPFLIIICILIGKKIKHNASARQDKIRSNDIEDINPTNMRSNLEPENMFSNPREQETMHQFGNPDIDYDMPSDIVPACDADISEYDILSTDLRRQQIKGQSSTRRDMNCYGVHTGTAREDETNAYDHLEAHVCKQLQTSTDGIYNKVSSEDDDTYNTLKLKDKKDIGNRDIHEGNYSTFGKSNLSK